MNQARDERLKAALRENLKRRKAQARARAKKGTEVPESMPKADDESPEPKS